jgi:hypothetical protein
MRCCGGERDESARTLPGRRGSDALSPRQAGPKHGQAMTVGSNSSKPHDDHLLAREKALAHTIKEVAAELRLVDVVDFIAYIRNEQFANIEDLVNSSAELHFKPGTLTFGWAADLAVDWSAPPKIKLDMEFRHLAVSIFFCLMLEARQASVDIHCVVFDRLSQNPVENTRRLAEALEDARLPMPARAKE